MSYIHTSFYQFSVGYSFDLRVTTFETKADNQIQHPFLQCLLI